MLEILPSGVLFMNLEREAIYSNKRMKEILKCKNNFEVINNFNEWLIKDLRCKNKKNFQKDTYRQHSLSV